MVRLKIQGITQTHMLKIRIQFLIIRNSNIHLLMIIITLTIIPSRSSIHNSKRIRSQKSSWLNLSFLRNPKLELILHRFSKNSNKVLSLKLNKVKDKII